MDDVLLIVVSLGLLLFVTAGIAGALYLIKKKKKGGGGGGSGNQGESMQFKSFSASVGDTGKTNISTFDTKAGDDNGIGYSGVDLRAYAKIPLYFTHKGKKIRVYPCAVFQDHFSKFGYKVLRVTVGPKSVYVHVVDACDASQSVCKTNTSRNGLNFLVDLHNDAIKSIGIKSEILTTGTYTVVGEIPPYQLPTGLWIPGVQKTSDNIICGCTGKCVGNDVTWVPYNKCYK